MDLLGKISIQLRRKIQNQNYYNYNYNETSLRKLEIKNHKDFKIQINEFNSLYEIGITVNSEFILSVNNIDRILPIKKQKTFFDYPYQLFILNDINDPFVNQDFQIFWKRLGDKLINYRLLENEALFIYGNRICLALDSNRDLIAILDDILDDILDLINNYKKIFKKDVKKRILTKNIPLNLRLLIPLLKKWSISDDSDRQQLIEEIDIKQKRKLIKDVEPFMNEINEFLNSFIEIPMSEEAILMGNLTELVDELKIEIAAHKN